MAEQTLSDMLNSVPFLIKGLIFVVTVLMAIKTVFGVSAKTFINYVAGYLANVLKKNWWKYFLNIIIPLP